ncbi:hypothetical protein B0H63DRAFT_488214 [Podospora didyma]|uniref:DUF4419 domain-containing protein n=1 Tax=Podospora didyma TaxID=330526 RepID=A0AAE0K1G6_9PEZI|nr:hypothetical protein B0H63DRAFT_488214 [Podospora didyma]
MPITVKISSVAPRAWDRPNPHYAHRPESPHLHFVNPKATTVSAFLAGSAPDESRKNKELIQSSLTDEVLANNYITPSNNGFVNAIVRGYSHHHHVVLSPEDVWFSILTQLNFYINKNAEALRHLFVAHKGQVGLEILYPPQDWRGIDFGAFAKQMTEVMQQKILDPSLREWILPNFSTTTDNDTVVASILMMGALQKYFTYTCGQLCGLPSVTLLGERDDWVKLLRRLGHMPHLGEEPAAFARLLDPILRRFVGSFDYPAHHEVIDFWSRAVNREVGSGMDSLNGWVTAFCFWDSMGRCTYTGGGHGGHGGRLILDGVQYGSTRTEEIPSGYVGVPVIVIDTFENKIPTRMVAGVIGIEAMKFAQRPGASTMDADANVNEDLLFDDAPLSGRSSLPGENISGMDTIQPVIGWWMFRTEEVDE